MAKTQRRRTARAARDAGQRADTFTKPLDYLAATKWLQDHNRWKRLQAALQHLVVIEFTSPFIDTELNCPEEAHLVVHLEGLREQLITPTPSSRRQQPPTPDLQMRVARTLDALATLCVTAQLLRPWEDLYQRFWERVAESDVMMIPIQAPTVDKWVRFTRGRGIPVLLSWSDTPFDPSQLLEPLRKFLSTPRLRSSSVLLVTIGFRFVRASLTTEALETLRELLVVPSVGVESLLIDPVSLRTLWFDSNPLFAPELSVLAALLSDPLTRRVDELKLENCIVDNLTQPAFASALSLVFVNACTLKTHCARCEAPALSLSLARNDLFTEHLEIFRQALTVATRPVRAISLSDVYLRTGDACEILIDLISFPLQAAAPRATINLSRVLVGEEDLTSLGFKIQDTIASLWNAGAIGHQNIECRLQDASLKEYPTGGGLLSVTVPPDPFYTIQDYDPLTGFVMITVSNYYSGNAAWESVTGWVAVSSIVGVRHDGVVVVGTSFTRLIFNGPTGFDYVNTLIELKNFMGSELQSLALEGHELQATAWQRLALSKIVLSSCPQLRELSLERSDLTTGKEPNVLDAPDLKLPSTLQILNLSYCQLLDTNFPRLEKLPLRYLSLLGNRVGAVGVECVLAMLRTNRELKTVELTHQYSQPASPCVSLRARIEALLERDYIQPRGKAAVLARLQQQQNQRLPFLGNDLVALIFEFVGTKPTRVVAWYY